jgi:predicted O-linked N-acetylglucosamine transferase (SPINDLY family)
VLRLGLISRFFHHHSVMRCFARLFMALAARPPFELHLIAASSLLQDQLTVELRRSAASWTLLQGDLPAQAAQIQRLELDLLIYTDTLLDAQTYLLSHYRLAPRQLLLPGQPVTSGVSTLDAFVSDQLSEPPDADAHYSERLIRLPHWPTLYERPALAPPLSPAALGLPPGRVYLCAASVFKLHPQMDAVFAGILQQDPQAQLLLLELSAAGLTARVRARLAEQLSAEQLARLHLWPKQPPARFSALLQAVHVLLETFPFGSLNTLMVALAAGTPMVTWPAAFVRGRYARTLLLRMECPELIATSAEDYVQIAVQVARDADGRQRIRQRFAAFSDRLFDNPVALPEVQDLLLQEAGWS